MSAARIAKAAIKIPKRIERGPTDLLKALASTVKHVPNEPDQLIMDDPFLMPVRPIDRNFYSMSRLSGMNAAKFLLNKHPELFYRDDSEPKVRTFLPPEEYRDDMDFTVDDLKWCIDNNDPVNGIVAYNWLSNNQVKLDSETLLQFFELLCYTNEEGMLDFIGIQKNYFLRESDRDLVDQTWKVTGLVSKIFNQIKADLDPSRVFSTMIAGLSKFNEHATAKQVFQDFRESHPNDALYVEAYDGLLNSVPNLNSSVASAHEAVETIVKHMEQHLVMPNLRIFNSILNVYRRFVCDELICKKALGLVNDMRALDIEPSLFTYSGLISIIYRSRSGGQYGDVVVELLDYIYNNDQILNELRDDRDVQFLGACMRLFANQQNNMKLANKLHRIYMKRPNLFAHVGQKQTYLDHYFRLIITTERLENIWKFYTTYVPMNFRPSSDSYDALAEALDLYQADEAIVKKVGRDLVDYKLYDKVKNDAIFRKDPNYVEMVEAQVAYGFKKKQASTSRRDGNK